MERVLGGRLWVNQAGQGLVLDLAIRKSQMTFGGRVLLESHTFIKISAIKLTPTSLSQSISFYI
jgi:hypothetical protein